MGVPDQLPLVLSEVVWIGAQNLGSERGIGQGAYRQWLCHPTDSTGASARLSGVDSFRPGLGPVCSVVWVAAARAACIIAAHVREVAGTVEYRPVRVFRGARRSRLRHPRRARGTGGGGSHPHAASGRHAHLGPVRLGHAVGGQPGADLRRAAPGAVRLLPRALRTPLRTVLRRVARTEWAFERQLRGQRRAGGDRGAGGP